MKTFFILLLSLFLTACASSNVSREVTSNIDQGIINNEQRIAAARSSTMAEAYQNTNQRTKGAIIGGASGLVTAAAITTSVGIFPATLTGAIIGASYGSYIDANTTMMDQLKNRNVDVLALGDQRLLVIPSGSLFSAWGSTIKPDAYTTLYLIAKYISDYTPMAVRVAAYSNANGSPRMDLQLTKDQAQAVAKFLWYSGMNARFIYAEGMDGSNLISKNTGSWNGDNYRVEISFAQLPT
jgi:outer membrane protein OmpA-like peptidoglycan-associated protein